MKSNNTNRMKREYILIIALGLFLAFGMLAIDFMRKPVPIEKKEPTKESFSVAPTKVSECNCLPGYIASNTVYKSPNGGNVLHYKGSLMFNPDGTKDTYGITQCVMCNNGYSFCDPNVFIEMTNKDSEFKTYTYKGTFNCEIQAAAKDKKDSDTYFCKKLGDPTQTKACY